MGLVYKKMVTLRSYTMFAAVTKAQDFWQTLTGGSHTPSLLSGRLAMIKIFDLPASDETLVTPRQSDQRLSLY